MNEEYKEDFPVNPNNFTDAGNVSEQIRLKLIEMKINPEIIRRVTMAVYECELNMIIHANGGLICAQIKDGSIEVEAADNGPGIEDIEQATTEGFTTISPDSDMVEKGIGKGMGFTKIKKCTDKFEIESEVGFGTTIRFGIRLS
ncbi:MAG: ATP-binding protein [Oscillospiraceae bacterium]|nr:ATP-binding protein [Oscillospiraceae bacterium]